METHLNILNTLVILLWYFRDIGSKVGSFVKYLLLHHEINLEWIPPSFLDLPHPPLWLTHPLILNFFHPCPPPHYLEF